MYVIINILFNFFQKFNFTFIHFLLSKQIFRKKSRFYSITHKENKFIDREEVLAQSIYKYQPLLQIKDQLIQTIQKDILRKTKALERVFTFLEKVLIHDRIPIISYCWEYGGFNFRYRKKTLQMINQARFKAKQVIIINYLRYENTNLNRDHTIGIFESRCADSTR